MVKRRFKTEAEIAFELLEKGKSFEDICEPRLEFNKKIEKKKRRKAAKYSAEN